MKTLITPLFVALYSILLHSTNPIHAQATELVAPPDIVISQNFSFSFIRLNDAADSLYGRMVFSIAERRQFFTRDVVCKKFCDENKYTAYPGNTGNDSAALLACDYYEQLYDSSQQFKQYNLNWGLDGYVLTTTPEDLKLTIIDHRVCGQGLVQRVFSATAANNITLRDTQNIWIVDCVYEAPQNLACQSDVDFNFGANCKATIDPQQILVGTGYCYDSYEVEIRDWITNAIIDRDTILDGKQIDFHDIGRTLKVTIKDPVTGSNCYGRLRADDNTAPVMKCPGNITIQCGDVETPYNTGFPSTTENCGKVNHTFKDFNLNGNCDSVYEHIIRRTWTAIDQFNNQSTCLQLIQINRRNIADVVFPPDYDDTVQAALICNKRIDESFNPTTHMLASPLCADGFILDSIFWEMNPGNPNVYPDRRQPRVLGWNAYTDSKLMHYRHPHPESVYYPKHPNWNVTDSLCWNSGEHIMWQGTGTPSGYGCRDFGMTFFDSIVNQATCDTSNSNCFTIFRKWFVLDWCTQETREHIQEIRVIDTSGPQLLYPDSIVLNIPPNACEGRWEVPPAWLVDNCSNTVHYAVEPDDGVVLGDEVSGYVVTHLKRGIQNVKIIAWDCCGNYTNKNVILNVTKYTPPNAVCDEEVTVSITGNSPPGTNTAKIFAHDYLIDTTGTCPLFFKIIRLNNLLNTGSGSIEDQADDGTNCTRFNGDDDTTILGNQIYFDDFTSFCCADVGQTFTAILRVFDTIVGAGPVSPSSMNLGGEYYQRFSDCIIQVTVKDRSVPTLVPPPNMVVSCEFDIDLNKLRNVDDSTYGKFVNDLSLRRKVTTNDKVCYNFCVKNDKTGYPGNMPMGPPSNPPAPNRACEYYNILFDTLHENRRYELTWGFDGYGLSACDVGVDIRIEDLRICNEGRINRHFTATNSDGVKVTTTQTIWVVACENDKPNVAITLGLQSPPVNGFSDISIVADVFANCNLPEDIILTYIIDEFNDHAGNYPGGYDYTVGPLSMKDYNNGLSPLIMDNPRAFNQRNPSDASGRYPIGIHRIEWTAEDLCGNVNKVSQIFEIKQTIATKETGNENAFSVQPNPSNGDIMIHSEKEIDQVLIYNSSGKLYADHKIINKHHLKLTGFTPGVYYIRGFNDKHLIGSVRAVIIE